MSAPTVGLRERKKEATRQALHQAAVGIAVERGLERLTVEAIADAADVSRRTFSNYFASKEEALLYSDQLRVRRLLDLVRARPEAERPWLALSAAAVELVSDPGADPGWTAQIRLLRRQSSLLAQQVATYAEAERALAQSVAGRLEPGVGRDLRARLLAAALLTALRIAVEQWIEDPGSTLPDILARVLDLAACPSS
jgi:AcrR family transcriptional regulator